MIYASEDVAEGIKRLGRSPEAKFLVQRLMETLISVPSPNARRGAATYESGRRSFARELIEALEPDAKNDGPDATELIRRKRPAGESSTARRFSRRVPDE